MLKRLTSLTLAVLCVSGYAWHDNGHMLIARIAYARLNKNVKAKVDHLVEVLTKTAGAGRTYDFYSAACWPDDIRRFGKDHRYDKWHYIDIPISADGTSAPQPPVENAVWAVNECVKALKDPKVSESDKAWRLAMLLHVVGDLQMPLHCAERFSKSTPKGDRGGNDFHIQFQGRNSNLHFFWDTGGGAFLPEVNRPPTPDEAKNLATMANDIVREHPTTELKGRIGTDAMVWAKEGNKLCQSFVYGLPEAKEPPSAYTLKVQSISRKLIALGGYRLAAVLNAALKGVTK